MARFTAKEQAPRINEDLFPYTHPRCIPPPLDAPGAAKEAFSHFDDYADFCANNGFRRPRSKAEGLPWVSKVRDNCWRSRPYYPVWHEGKTVIEHYNAGVFKTREQAYWEARWRVDTARTHWVRFRDLVRGEFEWGTGNFFTDKHTAIIVGRDKDTGARLATRAEAALVEARYKAILDEESLAQTLAGLNAVLGDIPA